MATVTNEAWDGSASRFTDEQWAASCILDLGDCSDAGKKLTAKMRYKIPVREPNGAINTNGLSAARGALHDARSPLKACPAAKQAASKRLAAAYNAAGKTPPSLG